MTRSLKKEIELHEIHYKSLIAESVDFKAPLAAVFTVITEKGHFPENQDQTIEKYKGFQGEQVFKPVIRVREVSGLKYKKIENVITPFESYKKHVEPVLENFHTTDGVSWSYQV